MITTFDASSPTYDDTTQRNSTWKGDESTIGAPGEDPEYGAGDPERVLALAPGGRFKSAQKRFSQEEEKGLSQVHSVPPNIQTYHRAAPSADSYRSSLC